MSSSQGFGPSVNALAGKLVDELASKAQSLRVAVSTGAAGERCIDLGANVPGSLEAGRLLGEICMGGLGTVAITASSPLERWPLGVVVHSSNPVVSCLGSQYAGWTITDDAGFFALGSGPARALSRVEELYKELGYVDHHNTGAIVIEGDSPPPPAVATKVAEACGIKTADLTVLYAPTSSLAGTVQIAARVLEVALHKAHSLHFDLCNIVDGYGVAPIAPPVPDFVKAMGRTNDAIIYGGRIQLFVRGADAEAEKLANSLPSSSCAAYGKPFADIFSEVGGDFYKIDASLFSPAVVTVSNLDTGTSFQAGKLAPDIVDASFK